MASDTRTLFTPTLGLIWFGAAVSLAEILTGTFFAPLGFEWGIAAILVGHLIGCTLFCLVAFISAKTGTSAMQAIGRSFGRAGTVFFSVMNVAQLVGWTAIMVMSGAAAAALLIPSLGMSGWALVIGLLIVLWIAIGVKRMGRVQSIAAVLLFVLTIIASTAAFGTGIPLTTPAEEGLPFGAAIELAVAMPLSWLPVVGDYTREAKRAGAGSVLATTTYFFGSCWMFIIGLGCALFAGSDDIAAVLSQSGLGAAGILIVVFSTVTTTFLDAQSAGISAEAIHPHLNARACGVAAAVLGTALAIFAPVGDFEGFLYLIGSVFAPAAAVLVADYFILHRNAGATPIDWRNAVLWLAGFCLYRLSLSWDIPCGNTLPVMAFIVIAAIIVNKVLDDR